MIRPGQDEWLYMDLNVSLFRIALFGPVATTWFSFLQRKIVLKNQNLEIIARVVSDQTVFAGCNLFCFLGSMAIMEGSDPKEKLRKNYTNALTRNWMVWPFVQLSDVCQRSFIGMELLFELNGCSEIKKPLC
ncbi:hypothetical protein HI914_04702 [Erysiphe necator]|nr:hypothetical protein HI914_04702 [Erysiphe necator]